MSVIGLMKFGPLRTVASMGISWLLEAAYEQRHGEQTRIDPLQLRSQNNSQRGAPCEQKVGSRT